MFSSFQSKLILRRTVAICTVGMAVFLGGFNGTSIPYANATKMNPSAVSAQMDDTLFLTRGKADVVPMHAAVADVLVADPSIVDVVALKANQLYIVGNQLGDTNIIAVDEAGNVVKRLDVHVKIDDQGLHRMLQNLFPDELIEISTLSDQIVLTGKASTPGVASQIADIVAQYLGVEADSQTGIVNLMQVAGEQQVTLRVKIVEASRSILKELGIDTQSNPVINDDGLATFEGTGPFIDQNATSSFVSALRANASISQDPIATLQLFRDSTINGIGRLGLTLRALEEDNLANILAEPNLTSVSGEQAGFLAGGEFPVPAGRDNVGNLIIEYRSFGVSLNFRPRVLSNDRISLQLDTEVSSLDFSNPVSTGDLIIPGLDIRRASSTIELSSGGSLMIAGLLESSTIEGMRGLPGIADTPVLGDLISSDSFQREETELLVIVTAFLVEPYAAEDYVDKKAPVKVVKKPLANAFEANLRRTYGDRIKDPLSGAEEATEFGYILD